MSVMLVLFLYLYCLAESQEEVERFRNDTNGQGHFAISGESEDGTHFVCVDMNDIPKKYLS